MIPLRSLAAVARRPSLWRVALRMVPKGWWKRWPPVPLPPPDYRRFRTETMYGSGGVLEPEDLVAYLEWCRSMGDSAR